MLQFRIGSIPVQVRPSHLIFAAFIAMDWMQVQRAPDTQSALLAGLGGMVVVFGSILFHELGHAFSMRAFGYQPSVVIEGLGGYTSPNTDQPIPWLKDVLLTLAGPLAGLSLAVAGFVGFHSFKPDEGFGAGHPLWAQLLNFVAWGNLLWSVLNLVPVLPLDGGRVSHTVFTRLFGKRGILFSQGLALPISVAAVAYGLSQGQQNILLAALFGMFGFRAVQNLVAYVRGQVPSTETHPAELAFVQATSHFREGRLLEAQRMAERALQIEPAPHPSVHLRLHRLSGWISLKDGRGPDALQHFGRMEKQEIEAHALAAAFSLSGDDARALPLWEMAVKAGGDATLVHEYAGALIRSGRVDEARALPNVDMLAAWRAAERVPSIRGDFLTAAELGRQASVEFPRSDLAYDTACAFARAGRVAEAQSMLERASELGFGDAAHAASDSDLDALRSTPAFKSWIERVRKTGRS